MPVQEYLPYVQPPPTSGVEALAHQLLLNSAQSRLGAIAVPQYATYTEGNRPRSAAHSAVPNEPPRGAEPSEQHRIPVYARIPIRPRYQPAEPRAADLPPPVPFLPHPGMFDQYILPRH